MLTITEALVLLSCLTPSKHSTAYFVMTRAVSIADGLKWKFVMQQDYARCQNTCRKKLKTQTPLAASACTPIWTIIKSVNGWNHCSCMYTTSTAVTMCLANAASNIKTYTVAGLVIQDSTKQGHANKLHDEIGLTIWTAVWQSFVKGEQESRTVLTGRW